MTTTRVARVPYLNSAPFFRGLPLGDRFELTDCMPRQLGQQAAAGHESAGLLSLIDFFRLEERFERLGHFGLAVRGRAHSVLLFSRQPIRQLDGATISVTEETSTAARLLRLVLEQRYRISPQAYRRGDDPDADALLLIGDAALRFQRGNTRFPFEVDLAFEWWLWQHVPFVFAVWAIRSDARAQVKRELESGLARALGTNLGRLPEIAAESAASFGLPAGDLEHYLSSFLYRLGHDEEEGIRRFRDLVHEHHLLGTFVNA